MVTTTGGVLCDGPTPVAQATERCQELLRTYGSDATLGGVVTRFLSYLYAMAGRVEEARDHALRSSLVLDELDQVSASWVYRRIAAEARSLIGDYAGARHELEERWRHYRAIERTGLDARALHAAVSLAKGELKPGAKSYKAGALGEFQIAGDNILLGKPFIFNKANIDQFDF